MAGFFVSVFFGLSTGLFFNEAQAQVKMEYAFGFPSIRLINEKPQTLSASNAKNIFVKDFKITTKGSEFVKLNINGDYELNIFDNCKPFINSTSLSNDLHIFIYHQAYISIIKPYHCRYFNYFLLSS